MIKYKQGDLIQAFENKEVDVIAHVCNGTVGMGAGIAKVIADKYPFIKELDKQCRLLYVDNKELLMGSAIGKNNIYNLYAQMNPGSPKLEGFDTFEQRKVWLENSLVELIFKVFFSSIFTSEQLKNIKFGLPLLSSGLAKKRDSNLSDLNYFKENIKPIVKKLFKEYDVTIYYL